MEREAFLARVRQAAEAGRAHRVHLAEVPARAGYVGAGEDRCAALAAEVEAVGGTATVADSPVAARQYVAELLARHEATSALCWQHDALNRLEIHELLTEARIAWHDYSRLAQLPREQQREIILAADIGISSVDFAVAETGTLGVGSRPGRERVISLAPSVHVAIVEQSQIVPDLFDAFAQLGQLGFDELPSNLAFITGPSKTGDIELQLTTGVHGPGNWHVVIVRTA